MQLYNDRIGEQKLNGKVQEEAEGRGQFTTVNYTTTKSFKITLSFSLAQKFRFHSGYVRTF